MPLLPFAGLSALGWMIYARIRNLDGERTVIAAQQAQAVPRPEEKVEDLLVSDRIGVEIGYRLIPLVDKDRGGTLLDRVTALRKQLAREQGLLVPPIRIKDNLQLAPTSYRVLLHGQAIASGELQPERLLAIDGGSVTHPVQGQATKEPAFGLAAVWIEASRRSEAEALGYTVTDPAAVFITHLTALLKANASQILSREDVQAMLEGLKKEAPVLVKDIETNAKMGTVQKVLATLLDEKVPLVNLEKILEAVADTPTADATLIAESARTRLGRAITARYLDAQGRLMAVILEPTSEARLAQGLGSAQHGGSLGIAPTEASTLVDQLGRAVQDAAAQGHDAVLLTTAPLRRHLRAIVSRFYPDLAVVSFSELPTGLAVEVVGTVALGSGK
jgi:flagellar biosynthesis protein FlhA